jgi:hypothetical protein
MCDTLLIVSEVTYTHFGENAYRKASGRTFTRWLFFLHDLWYNNFNKSTRPLEEAQEGGYLPASPVLYLGMKKAVAR